MSTQRKSPARPTGKSSSKSKTAAVKTAARRTAGKDDGVSLEPILAVIRKRLPKAQHAEGEAFANIFYHRMGEDEWSKHTPEGWAALAADILDFARKRKPGTALVRLFNPTVAEHGWESPHTVVQIVNDDMPFLVDSVTMALAEAGTGLHVLGHPVVSITRDKSGKLLKVGEGASESLMHLEIDRLAPEAMPAIEQTLKSVLDDVRAIVGDWAGMRGKMLEVADDLAERKLPIDAADRQEGQEFLRWAADDHFTFLGYREYDVVAQDGEDVLRAVKGSGLGLLRGNDTHKPRALASLAATHM
ncbi:MAG TPA: NAD-glutamate dehydrogenase, partial [Lysobacter sp.]|nr:NAD-glutamate dehydrogenase [Lysobacter sp.]